MNENNERIKQKISFYYQEKYICHVIKNPKPTFVNGTFKSGLIDEQYYLFEDMRFPGKEIRLFLFDIFDVVDYEVKG